jgi:hypothetical protein
MENKRNGEFHEVEIKQDWSRPKPLQVENADPSKAYRWVNKDRFEERKREGWDVVRDERVKHSNPEGSSNGVTKEYREMILCEMPRQVADARNKYYVEKARQAADSPERLFHQQARRLGIRTDI